MIKHKNITASYNKTTTIFGYGLFILTVISFLTSTAIPMSISLIHPTARHFNIAIMIVAFAVATILPALVSYIIGDRATHAKNKSLHHYNGVLFGIAAYWCAQLFSWIGFSSMFSVSDSAFPISLTVTNVIPVILAIIVMAIVAVTYAKQPKSKVSALQHRPFQIVLIVSVVGALLYPYGGGDFDMQYAAISFTLITIPFITAGIAYKLLGNYNATRLSRLTDALVAMSMGWIATSIAYLLTSLLQLPYLTISVIAYAAGLIVFAAYLYLRIRKQ